MSFEGYYVTYCANGHMIGCIDAHLLAFAEPGDSDYPECVYCKQPAKHTNLVDETNGCYCDDLTDEERAKFVHCPAHPIELPVIRQDEFDCLRCNGIGGIEAIEHKTKRNILVECHECNGTGKKMVNVYDVNLLYKNMED